jgi:PBP1b-binding outer membrane lipoprotein LpoB
VKKTKLAIAIFLAIGLTGCSGSSSDRTNLTPAPTPTVSSTGSAFNDPSASQEPLQPNPSATLLVTSEPNAPTPPSRSEQAIVKAKTDKIKADELATLAKEAEERLTKIPAGTADAARAAEEAQSLKQSAETARKEA